MGVELLVLACVVALILVAAVGFAPRSSEVEGSDLRVHTRIKTFHYDLNQVESAEQVAPDDFTWRATLRISAVGWPLKP